MKITIHKEDEQYMKNFFAAPCLAVETDSPQAGQIQQSLQLAIQQKNIEAEGDRKRTLIFLLLFIFLYAALGALLTLDLSSSSGHKSIEYALEAIPVLIAFSGFFVSILFGKEASEYNVRVTLISPGAVSTELLDHISDKEVQSANQAYVGKVGIPPETFARMVAFAINEPKDVGVNEIIFRPTV